MHNWQKGVIGDLAQGVRGVSYRPEHLLSSFATDAAVLLRSTNIQGGKITFENVQFVPTFLVSDQQRVNQHDIVVCMSNGSKALVGKSAPCKTQFRDVLTIGAFCSVFHPRPAANSSFVAHLFNGDAFRRCVDITLAGSAINNLRNGDLECFPCPIPKPAEQSRIAAALDTMDEAVAKTEAVIVKLRQLRAGLLHNLLTRGLDTYGQLRDPIARPDQFQNSPLGRIPREWNVKTLESCVSSEITYGIVQAGPHLEDGVPYIRTGDMRGDQLVADEMLRTSPEIAGRFRRSRVQAGEIVCAIRATVGKVLPVPPELNGANLTQGTARIAPKSDIDSTFLLWAIRGDRTQREIAREVKGTTFFEITLADLRKIQVAIPRDPEEQQRIARAIQALEARLANETNGLSKLQSLKSGLMTDLLTGRVRVPAQTLTK